MFAIVQFGPLAAARDIGIGLTTALAMEAWLARSRHLWLAAGFVALVGFMPTILAALAPFSDRSAVCLECGMKRETHDVCGWMTKDQILETEASRWAASLVLEGHQHSWITTSRHQRTHWFGMATIGCGGPGEGAFMAWQLAHYGDQSAAEQAYREYQKILAGKSTKSMAIHRQEVWNAVDAAAKAKR